MTAEHFDGALAGASSEASRNRSPFIAGSDSGTPCAGSGFMSDADGTRSGPAVGV